MTKPIYMIAHGNAAVQAARIIASAQRTKLPVAKSPAVQLEIAAQWLKEAALALQEHKQSGMALQLSRVAHDCEAAARRVG